MTRASSAPYGPKVIWAGSAVDQEVHEYGVNFARLREAGIAEAPRMSWQEWSIPFDNPDAVTEDVLNDPAMWLLANPSMEDGLISAETMEDELQADAVADGGGGVAWCGGLAVRRMGGTRR